MASVQFAKFHRECTAQTCQTLGEDSYIAAVNKGAKLDLDQVIRYALDEQAQQAPMVCTKESSGRRCCSSATTTYSAAACSRATPWPRGPAGVLLHHDRVAARDWVVRSIAGPAVAPSRTDRGRAQRYA